MTAPALDDFQRLQHAWNTYNNAQTMIMFADRKVGILLVISGIMTSFVFANVTELLQANTYTGWLLLLFFCTFGGFLLFGLRAIFAHGPTRSGASVPRLLFFGHVAQRTEAVEYLREFKAATDQQILDDLLYQIFEVSHIANAKFNNYKRAWWALGLQCLCFAVLMGVAA